MTRGVPPGWSAPPRPDLAVPLVRAPVVLSHVFAGPRRPDFGRSHRQNVVLAAVAVVVFALSRLLWSTPVALVAVGVVAYAFARFVFLLVLERNQDRFGERWLSECSRDLRDSEFPVVRLSADDRFYDLTDTDRAARLLHLSDERPATPVVIDFSHPPSALERVGFALGEVQFRAVEGAEPRVRFPEARYRLDDSALRTFWQLGGSAVVTLGAPTASGAARAGTGRSDPPGAGRSAGGRGRGSA
ncbi:hypothetical protein [Actinokineospora spheciospongiae]|uniref:hypothetical protein n=1 Tax=Actinokineospora spheciospongiae TaxID=909613 RepID=UPI001268DE1A|nr:hypothetical protein [Actinokineospora spheciospongiae]